MTSAFSANGLRRAHRAASFAMPPEATDCHIHVFGPAPRYPLAAGRNYTPADATLAEYQRVAAQVGLERVVFVQPSVYGMDNAAILDAMAALGPHRARGVAALSATVSDAEFEQLNARGIRGVRLFMGASDAAALDRARAQFAALHSRLAGTGWHIELLTWLPVLAALQPQLARSSVPLVFAHMARPAGKAERGAAAFAPLVTLMAEGPHWTKLSAPYRTGVEAGDSAPYMATLLQRFGDRLVWGSDWPHPQWDHHLPRAPAAERDDVPSPGIFRDEDFGDLLDSLVQAGVDTTALQRVLVDNPRRLYGFD